jgi:hypothetical protein
VSVRAGRASQVQSRALGPAWLRSMVEQQVHAPMKIQAGIKLLNEIEGYGDPIQDSDRFDAVLKFYRNKGNPLEFETILQDSIPYVVDLNGKPTIAWNAPKMHKSNVVYERYRVLARQAGVLPGIFYTILGMRTMGYRNVAIPPHLFAHSMHEVCGIDRESVIKLEVFLLRTHPKPAQPTAAPTGGPAKPTGNSGVTEGPPSAS